jgi:hypothetical protein
MLPNAPVNPMMAMAAAITTKNRPPQQTSITSIAAQIHIWMHSKAYLKRRNSQGAATDPMAPPAPEVASTIPIVMGGR